MRIRKTGQGSYRLMGVRRTFTHGSVYDVDDAVGDTLMDSGLFEIVRDGVDESLVMPQEAEAPPLARSALRQQEADTPPPTTPLETSEFFPPHPANTDLDADDSIVDVEEVLVEPPALTPNQELNAFNRYDCPYESCDKVGDDGYIRMASLENHIDNKH